jgi:hypothetical protein
MIEWMKTLPQDAEVECGVEVREDYSAYMEMVVIKLFLDMAEVKLGTLYKVTVVEYDSGAQRVDPNDGKYFTTLEEAEKYKAHWEDGGSRECYWRASITKM